MTGVATAHRQGDAHATTHLLYLHGFRSSPASAKARRVARAVELVRAAGTELHWECPQLPPSPARALDAIVALTAAWPSSSMAVIGSSLGGLYATVLAERRGCRAVLLNPAVDPARDLSKHIGRHTAWHDPELRFDFTAADVDALRGMRPAVLTRPERYHAVIATGDEVLDWREMRQRYAGCEGTLVHGSDHALSDFDRHLPGVLAFLRLPVQTPS